MYFDSHAHIASSPKDYIKIEEVVSRIKKAGVSKVVDSAVDIQTSKDVLNLHLKYPDLIIPTLGLHPEIVIPGSDIYNKDLDIDEEFDRLKKLYFDSKKYFKAVGECGLDYYWLDKDKDIGLDKKKKVKHLQELLFKRQIDFARKINLPLIIHTREVEKESFDLISSLVKNRVPVLFHSFTGDIKIAENIFRHGYYISFNGIITYPSGENIREIFKLGFSKYQNQILAETDSPYLTPQQRRGQVCEPSDVRYVVDKMAELSKFRVGYMADLTYANACKFYSL